MAIMKFIDSISNNTKHSLFSTDPIKQAKIIEIAEIHNSYIQPVQGVTFCENLQSHATNFSNQEIQNFVQEHCYRGMKASEELIGFDCDDRSGGPKFCVGNEYSAADLFLYAMVVNCVTRHGMDIKEFPKIKKVMDSMMNEDFVKRAHPLVQVDADDPAECRWQKWPY